MKAVVNEAYGSPDRLDIRELPTPQPEAGEILIRVHATTVSRTDSCALRAHPFFVRAATGLLRPRRTILGLDFAGTVEALGRGVVKFHEGDRVFGLTPDGYGAHAEYLCLPAEGAVSPMPPGKRFQELVVCEGAWYANTYLERFRLGPGHRILIYGASGAIGTSALQLAKIHGAEVTAVVSPPHLSLARELGADRVIDYTAEDFTALGNCFDFVLDAVGKSSYLQCRPLLKRDGVFAATDLGPCWQNLLLATWSALTGTGRVVFPIPRQDPSFLAFLRERIQAGEFRAVIDREYPLEKIAAAYRYVETEQKAGIVVIAVVEEDNDNGTDKGS
ncbi:NAD(P)-dependent alcohol dehydrogenase [Desulfogranum mediterraneum]|uniref:NAD(P)-dependent alcohol dehydrogenase n=1 Tax=Desulfogranum mediterraneum TaxID=160661 RepID=UPI000491B166|nr:NAD(P)-dependent alcohol dehydrogenase [Desulfogranum mediterraneum]